jgi:pimeloyl-ACP methyl ester carboxylesterase
MFIAHDDARFYAVRFGAGTRSLLAMGGWTGSWEVWSGPFSYLGQSWQMAGFDHRGSGATLAPAESITLDTLVKDVFAVLDALNISRVILAAESAGCAVAMQAALRNPARVAGLVLAAPLYYRPRRDGADPFLDGLKTDYTAAVGQFVDACLPEAADDDAIRRWGRQILSRASQDAAIRLYECVDGLDLRPEVGRISQPTLVIHGDADRILPLESSQWLAAHMPDCQLRVFEGVGHAPTMTRPLDVARAIDQCFSGLV